jgi:four helix bundle protein
MDFRCDDQNVKRASSPVTFYFKPAKGRARTPVSQCEIAPPNLHCSQNGGAATKSCSCSSSPTRELREQLDRASLSALLNTAEGNGRRQGRQRAKFFDDVRGSAIECAACLDALVAKGFAFLERIQPAKEMLVRIVAMRTKLLMRFDRNLPLNLFCSFLNQFPPDPLPKRLQSAKISRVLWLERFSG